MGARIINFPVEKITTEEKSFDSAFNFLANRSSAVEQRSFSKNIDATIKSFNQILSDEELGKLMFPPEYFMLVE